MKLGYFVGNILEIEMSYSIFIRYNIDLGPLKTLNLKY